jgi:hypothetical protein
MSESGNVKTGSDIVTIGFVRSYVNPPCKEFGMAFLIVFDKFPCLSCIATYEKNEEYSFKDPVK